MLSSLRVLLILKKKKNKIPVTILEETHLGFFEFFLKLLENNGTCLISVWMVNLCQKYLTFYFYCISFAELEPPLLGPEPPKKVAAPQHYCIL